MISTIAAARETNLNIFQRIQRSIPNCVSWDKVKGAFSSLGCCLRSKKPSIQDKQITSLSTSQSHCQLFLEGLMKKAFSSRVLKKNDNESFSSETIKREKARRSFLLKCFAGMAAATTVGSGVYAIQSRWFVTKGMEANSVAQINLANLNSAFPFGFSSDFTAFPENILPQIVLTEEIPYSSKNWVISGLFGSDKNDAIVSASLLPKGITLINQNMRISNTVPTALEATSLAIRGNLIFLSDNSMQVSIIEVSNPLSPIIINALSVDIPQIILQEIALINSIYKIDIVDNYLYVFFGLHNLGSSEFIRYGLSIYEISDAYNCKKMGIFTIGQCNYPYEACPFTPSSLMDLGIYSVFDNHLLYTISSDGGYQVHFQITNITVPSSPRLMGNIKTQDLFRKTNPKGIAILDNSHVAVGMGNSFKVIDATNPLQPNFISSLSLPTPITNIMREGSYCYVSGKDNFYVINITNVTNPFIVGSTLVPGPGGVQITKVNDLCYMTAGTAVRVIDVSNPTRPLLLNSLFTGKTASRGIVVLGDYCFFSDSMGLRITPKGNTFSLQGEPAGGSQGNYTITLQAKNRQGLSINGTLNLIIQPAITLQIQIPNQMAVIGSNFNFFINSNTFKHVNGNTLKYSASPLPKWLKLNSNSGTFSGIPSAADARILNLKVSASDVEGSVASTPFQIKVVFGPSLNHPINNQNARIGEFFSFTFPLDAFMDKDGDTLEFSATNNGFPLPGWLGFNSSQRTFSGTPQEIDVGTVLVVLNARDPNGLTAETSFQIHAVVSLAPILLNPIANQIALVEQQFRFYVSSNTFDSPSGMAIKYSANLRGGSPLPAWLSFVNQTFSGQPGRGDTDAFSDRVLEVNLKASAGSGSSSHVFNINVSGESYALLATKIVGPIISVLGTAYTLYKKRAWILNRWNKKKYQKTAATAIIGKPFSKKLSVPATDVKAVRVLHKGKRIAHDGALPYGFRYNQFSNALESEKVPMPNDLEILTIQIIGEADKILEQFDLHIAANKSHLLLDPHIDSKAGTSKKKQGRKSIQMDEITTGLLNSSDDQV